MIFIASLHNTETIFEQLSVIYALPRQRINSLNVVLPYFPTGTMERVDTEGQIATANASCRCSRSPVADAGEDAVGRADDVPRPRAVHHLRHPRAAGALLLQRLGHSQVLFIPIIMRSLETAIPLLLDALAVEHEADEHNWSPATLAIAFPDEGAHKRFHRAFPASWHQIMCLKVRDGDARVVRLKDGDPRGRHVLVVDDLVQTGGTLLETVKLLHAHGAASVSCYVTHAVFPRDSWRRFIDPVSDAGNNSLAG